MARSAGLDINAMGVAMRRLITKPTQDSEHENALAHTPNMCPKNVPKKKGLTDNFASP